MGPTVRWQGLAQCRPEGLVRHACLPTLPPVCCNQATYRVTTHMASLSQLGFGHLPFNLTQSHSHIHSLSPVLVLVVMLKSKELKTTRSLMLILRFSLSPFLALCKSSHRLCWLSLWCHSCESRHNSPSERLGRAAQQPVQTSTRSARPNHYDIMIR